MSTIQKEDQEEVELLLCQALIAAIITSVLTFAMIALSIVFDSMIFPLIALVMFALFFVAVVIAMSGQSALLEIAISEQKESVRWNGVLNRVIKGILQAPRQGKDPYKVREEIIQNSPR